VFFDANSGSGTVTLDNTNGELEAGSLNCTGFTGTIVPRLFYYTPVNLYGNLTLGSGGTYGISGQTVNLDFYGSGTMVSNGTSTPYLSIITSGLYITLTLGDTFELSSLNIYNFAVFNTNNYNLTLNSFYTDTGTLNLGSSSITLSYFFAYNTATVNAGTSTINMAIDFQDPYDWEFSGGGHTYYNLNFLTDADTGTGYGGVYDNNTFHSITNSVQPIDVAFVPNTTQTITGTFGVSGTAGNLATLRSTLPGTQFTLSKSSGTVSTDYLSLQDSAATGGAEWYAGTHSTNVSNNTGWIFTAPPGPGEQTVTIGPGISLGAGVKIT
jgi:hypothetical protein